MNIVCTKKFLKLVNYIKKRIKINVIYYKKKKFSDTEIIIKFKQNIKKKKIIILYTMQKPISESIVEILLLINILKSNKIIIFCFYLAYTRQDKKEKFYPLIGIEFLIKLLKFYGVYKILTFESHSMLDVGFFKNIKLMNEIKKELKYKTNKPLLIFPDKGSYMRNKFYFKNFSFLIIKKQRNWEKTKVISYKSNIKNPKGMKCIIIDDILDTGGTILSTLKFCKKIKMKKFQIYIIHPLLSDNRFFLNLSKLRLNVKIFSYNTTFKKNFNLKILDINKKILKELLII
ncbi:ribose-phosphate diphosphokinase [Candidatus Vidania fulgoroideorum]